MLNWPQVFCIQNPKSSSVKLSTGDPQGSVLGPFLFTLYSMNNLIFVYSNYNIQMYADDLSIIMKYANICFMYKIAPGITSPPLTE